MVANTRNAGVFMMARAMRKSKGQRLQGSVSTLAEPVTDGHAQRTSLSAVKHKRLSQSIWRLWSAKFLHAVLLPLFVITRIGLAVSYVSLAFVQDILALHLARILYSVSPFTKSLTRVVYLSFRYASYIISSALAITFAIPFRLLANFYASVVPAPLHTLIFGPLGYVVNNLFGLVTFIAWTAVSILFSPVTILWQASSLPLSYVFRTASALSNKPELQGLGGVVYRKVDEGVRALEQLLLSALDWATAASVWPLVACGNGATRALVETRLKSWNAGKYFVPPAATATVGAKLSLGKEQSDDSSFAPRASSNSRLFSAVAPQSPEAERLSMRSRTVATLNVGVESAVLVFPTSPNSANSPLAAPPRRESTALQQPLAAGATAANADQRRRFTSRWASAESRTTPVIQRTNTRGAENIALTPTAPACGDMSLSSKPLFPFTRVCLDDRPIGQTHVHSLLSTPTGKICWNYEVCLELTGKESDLTLQLCDLDILSLDADIVAFARFSIWSLLSQHFESWHPLRPAAHASEAFDSLLQPPRNIPSAWLKLYLHLSPCPPNMPLMTLPRAELSSTHRRRYLQPHEPFHRTGPLPLRNSSDEDPSETFSSSSSSTGVVESLSPSASNLSTSSTRAIHTHQVSPASPVTPPKLPSFSHDPIHRISSIPERIPTTTFFSTSSFAASQNADRPTSSDAASRPPPFRREPQSFAAPSQRNSRGGSTDLNLQSSQPGEGRHTAPVAPCATCYGCPSSYSVSQMGVVNGPPMGAVPVPHGAVPVPAGATTRPMASTARGHLDNSPTGGIAGGVKRIGSAADKSYHPKSSLNGLGVYSHFDGLRETSDELYHPKQDKLSRFADGSVLPRIDPRLLPQAFRGEGEVSKLRNRRVESLGFVGCRRCSSTLLDNGKGQKMSNTALPTTDACEASLSVSRQSAAPLNRYQRYTAAHNSTTARDRVQQSTDHCVELLFDEVLGFGGNEWRENFIAADEFDEVDVRWPTGAIDFRQVLWMATLLLGIWHVSCMEELVYKVPATLVVLLLGVIPLSSPKGLRLSMGSEVADEGKHVPAVFWPVRNDAHDLGAQTPLGKRTCSDNDWRVYTN